MQRKLLPVISVATWWICSTLTYAATLSASGELGSHPKIAGMIESKVWLSQDTPIGHSIITELTLAVGTTDKTFIVNEGNVGDYGAVWSDILDWAATLITGESTYTDYKTLINWQYNGHIDTFGDVVVPHPPGGQPQYEPGTHLGSFTPEIFTFTYIAGPSVQLQWEVVGNGDIVPEPVAGILVAGSMLFGFFEGRYRHCSRSSTRSSRRYTLGVAQPAARV